MQTLKATTSTFDRGLLRLSLAHRLAAVWFIWIYLVSIFFLIYVAKCQKKCETLRMIKFDQMSHNGHENLKVFFFAKRGRRINRLYGNWRSLLKVRKFDNQVFVAFKTIPLPFSLGTFYGLLLLRIFLKSFFTWFIYLWNYRWEAE